MVQSLIDSRVNQIPSIPLTLLRFLVLPFLLPPSLQTFMSRSGRSSKLTARLSRRIIRNAYTNSMPGTEVDDLVSPRASSRIKQCATALVSEGERGRENRLYSA